MLRVVAMRVTVLLLALLLSLVLLVALLTVVGMVAIILLRLRSRLAAVAAEAEGRLFAARAAEAAIKPAGVLPRPRGADAHGQQELQRAGHGDLHRRRWWRRAGPTVSAAVSAAVFRCSRCSRSSRCGCGWRRLWLEVAIRASRPPLLPGNSMPAAGPV